MSNADLEYAGRERKRPPGASDLVQRIYMLLHDHPQGMTRDEIWETMREGWLETDAYRAYDHRLARRRKVSQHKAPTGTLNRGRRSAEYGSPLFKERAQKWWISGRLAAMRDLGTARREEHRWFVGERPPQITKEGKKRYYARLDVAAARAASQSDTQAHIRREQVKAELLGALNDPRTSKKRYQELARLAYEYISGR